MFNSAIIEVIVGMIFIYSLLSILVTQINTLITNLLNTRAKHLKTGIWDMITDPVVRAQFMAHPLIRLVPAETAALPEQSLSAQSAEQVTARDPATINYIPATLFSQALLDIIAAQAAKNLYRPLYDAVERSLNGADEARAREMVRRLQGSSISTDELRSYFETLPSPARQSLILTLDRTLKAQAALANDDTNSKLIPLLEGIRHVQEPVFQKALDTLLATARSVEEASAKLEFWFDTRMNQLSDKYKRNIQYLSLGVGLLLALALNVDSLHVARTLWDDPALRLTIAAAAQASIDSGALVQEVNPTQPDSAQPTLIPDGVPTPEGLIDPLTPVQPAVPTEPTTGELVSEARDSIDQLLNLRIPIGWEYVVVEGGCYADGENVAECDNPRNIWNLAPANNPGWFGFLVWKIVGYIITIVAVAQGAPFWFDLLNRLARGRSG
jgi:hypothetical protein